MELTKREHVMKLAPEGAICAELGVASGEFAEKVLSQFRPRYYFAIDRWNDHHNEKEYQACRKRLERFGDVVTFVRKTFDEALLDFPNNYFDLIYIDGYAHTGQENGKTLRDWYPKLKDGGVFSGDDYTSKYPLNILAVDTFAASINKNVQIINCSENTIWSKYPTWYFIK